MVWYGEGLTSHKSQVAHLMCRRAAESHHHHTKPWDGSKASARQMYSSAVFFMICVHGSFSHFFLIGLGAFKHVGKSRLSDPLLLAFQKLISRDLRTGCGTFNAITSNIFWAACRSSTCFLIDNLVKSKVYQMFVGVAQQKLPHPELHTYVPTRSLCRINVALLQRLKM